MLSFLYLSYYITKIESKSMVIKVRHYACLIKIFGMRYLFIRMVIQCLATLRQLMMRNLLVTEQL